MNQPKLPDVTNRRTFAISGLLILLIGVSGVGLVMDTAPANAPAPTYNETALDNSHVVEYVGADTGDTYRLYPTEGIICTSESTNTDNPIHCTLDPELTLEHLEYLGFYEEHPNVPRPPVNTSAS